MVSFVYKYSASKLPLTNKTYQCGVIMCHHRRPSEPPYLLIGLRFACMLPRLKMFLNL
jgi:hypothetical protein